eukprot:scaffold326985_cov57-Tisochrysis_lutea.AAC.1
MRAKALGETCRVPQETMRRIALLACQQTPLPRHKPNATALALFLPRSLHSPQGPPGRLPGFQWRIRTRRFGSHRRASSHRSPVCTVRTVSEENLSFGRMEPSGWAFSSPQSIEPFVEPRSPHPNGSPAGRHSLLGFPHSSPPLSPPLPHVAPRRLSTGLYQPPHRGIPSAPSPPQPASFWK